MNRILCIYPIWWMLRWIISHDREKWWWCRWINPYDKAVKNQIEKMNNPNVDEITEFVISIPWAGEKVDVWHPVGEVLANLKVIQDCEEHAAVWVSLMLAIGQRGYNRGGGYHSQVTIAIH